MVAGIPGETGTAGQKEEKASTTPGMAQFLEQVESFKSLRRGDLADGVVMRVAEDCLLVDVGCKCEGIIPAAEMRCLGADGLSRVKVGDEIIAFVLRGESEEGQVLLSLDRAFKERGWRLLEKHLEKNEVVEAEVIGYNRGGLVVSIEGVQGFVPLSQLAGLHTVPADAGGKDPVAARVGQLLQVKVLEVNRKRNRLILSERAALQERREQQKERLLGELREGEIRQGKVSGVCNFGIFVDLGGADGLIHLSELCWEPVDSPEKVCKVGDEVSVYVLKVDPQAKRIALSLRRAQPEPWEKIAQKYQVGQLVTGTVTKLTNFGAFARIDGSLEGLIHISELSLRRIAHPKEIVSEGDTVTLKVIRIEPERRRLGLSLKQAQEEKT